LASFSAFGFSWTVMPFSHSPRGVGGHAIAGWLKGC